MHPAPEQALGLRHRGPNLDPADAAGVELAREHVWRCRAGGRAHHEGLALGVVEAARVGHDQRHTEREVLQPVAIEVAGAGKLEGGKLGHPHRPARGVEPDPGAGQLSALDQRPPGPGRRQHRGGGHSALARAQRPRREQVGPPVAGRVGDRRDQRASARHARHAGPGTVEAQPAGGAAAIEDLQRRPRPAAVVGA